MTNIVFGTSNPKKLADLHVIPAPGIELLSLADIGVSMPDVVEDGDTFAANAQQKYEALRPLVPAEYILACEDSGLEIEALDNQPGVYSRRWNSEHREMTDEELINKTLAELVDKTDRSAQFVSAIMFGYTMQDQRAVHGVLHGSILSEIDETQHISGMPYRALFYVDEAGLMLQELIDTPYGSRAVRTHRELAWQKALSEIKKTLAF